MSKITTHLWFDKEPKKAASFYTATFKDAKKSKTPLWFIITLQVCEHCYN